MSPFVFLAIVASVLVAAGLLVAGLVATKAQPFSGKKALNQPWRPDAHKRETS